jgi:hypothetical protein
VEVTGLSVDLAPGTYWLNVTPVGDGSGRSFDSDTSGTNCVGLPCGNDDNAFINSSDFGFVFHNTSSGDVGQPDFSMGVNGTIQGGGCGTPSPTPTATATATFTPTATATATTTASATPTATASTTATATPTPTATASCTVSYTTATTTGTVTAGGTDIGNHCDDCLTPINLPFPVNVYGAPVSVAFPASNGDLHFAETGKMFAYAQCVPVDPTPPDGPFLNTLFPFYDDLRTDETGICPDCGIFTQTLGTAPHRQFVIRWKTTFFTPPAGGNNAEFEVILTEGSDTLSVIYGDTSGDNGLTAASGIQQDLTHFTSFSCFEETLTSGVRVDYIPTGCGSPTPTPTATPTATATATATTTATATPTATATATPTATATATPTATATATATATPTPRPTPTPRTGPTPRPRPTPPPRP